MLSAFEHKDVQTKMWEKWHVSGNRKIMCIRTLSYRASVFDGYYSYIAANGHISLYILCHDYGHIFFFSFLSFLPPDSLISSFCLFLLLTIYHHVTEGCESCTITYMWFKAVST